jgi:hypothetical protein
MPSSESSPQQQQITQDSNKTPDYKAKLDEAAFRAWNSEQNQNAAEPASTSTGSAVVEKGGFMFSFIHPSIHSFIQLSLRYLNMGRLQETNNMHNKSIPSYPVGSQIARPGGGGAWY